MPEPDISLSDGELVLRWTASLTHPVFGVLTHYFQMMADGNVAAGRINLRLQSTEDIVKYAGHIGYAVDPAYRGRHFAARSVGLLLPYAYRYPLQPLWITCNPDNFPSRRTCESAGGKLIEIVDVPPDNVMYLAGSKRKCRYLFEQRLLEGG